MGYVMASVCYGLGNISIIIYCSAIKYCNILSLLSVVLMISITF